MFKVKHNMASAILSGGKSSRFGKDKALSMPKCLSGKSVLTALVEMLAVFHMPSVVVVDREDKYKSFGCDHIVDLLPEKGPLGGIYTALSHFKEKGCEAVLVVSCDMPCLHHFILKRLLDDYQRGLDAVCFKTQKGIQPFPGIYAQRTLAKVQSSLSRNRLGMREFLLQQVNVKWIDFSDEDGNFFNMNTLADYESLNAKELL